MKIFIIVFKEYKNAMPNDSAHSKKTLEQLHPNIKVIRHPGQKFWYWSHHEKSVLIDQKVGYVGGLDLCLGRYDTNEYRLKEPDSNFSHFPGADYNNVRFKDFDVGRNFSECLIEKTKIPRMPWRDVHVRLEGEIVNDMNRSFIQYWSFMKNDIESGAKEARIMGLAKELKQKEPKKTLVPRSSEKVRRTDHRSVIMEGKYEYSLITRRGSIDYEGGKNKLSVPIKKQQDRGNTFSPDSKLIVQRKFTSDFPQKRVFSSEIKKTDDGLLSVPTNREHTPNVKTEPFETDEKPSNDIDELIEHVKQTSFILDFEE